MKFCGNCGKRLDGAAPSSPEPDAHGGGRTMFMHAADMQGLVKDKLCKLITIDQSGREGMTFTIKNGETICGRVNGIILFFDDPYVSPTHCKFSFFGGQLKVADQGSLNGVYVRVKQERRLADGELIRVGRQLFRFESMRSAAFQIKKADGDDSRIWGSPTPAAFGRLVQILEDGRTGEIRLLTGDRCQLGREIGDIVMPTDGFISGRHCVFTHVDGEAVLTDLGSSNGTIVDEHLITGPTLAEPGAFIQIGATVIAVEAVQAADLPELAPIVGANRPFARRFREALPPLPDKLRAPTPRDDDDEPHRALWWRSLVPLLSGFGLFLFAGQKPVFLIVTALAPLVMFYDSRRTQREQDRKRDRQAGKASQEQADFLQRLGSTLVLERARRRQLAPAAGLSALHAALKTRRIWDRSSDDADFAAVTVGLAHLPTSIAIEWPDQTPTPHLWWVPVEVPLLATGSLAILGPHERSQAVVRGMVLSLATSHSPADLRIWVLTEPDRAEGWAFARWLPHTFVDDHGARIATTPTDRAQLMKALGQVLDNR
ncbi:MAG TPA: FHA domain-containing protein, partial [Acidimicrobiales bacterium]